MRDAAIFCGIAVRATPPAGSLRFAVSGRAPGGGAWANTFWIACTVATPTTAQMNTIAGGLYSAWATDWLPYMASDWTVTLAKATYYGASGYVIVGEEIETDVGGASASGFTDQVCLCVSWLVSTTWRGGKPRTYFPGLVATSQLLDKAHINSTLVGQMESASGDWLSDVNAFTSAPLTSCTLGTIRFFSGGVPLATPQFLPYTGSFVHNRVATIRRRLGRET